MQLDLFSSWATKNQPQRASDERLSWRGHPIIVRRKPYSRRWSLHVEPDGEIRLTCPKGASLRALNEWLREMSPWLQAQLLKVKLIQERFPKKQYLDGEIFDFKGRPHRLEKRWASHAKAQFESTGTLLVFVQLQHQPQDVRDLVHACYRREAQSDLPPRMSHWADRMGLWPSSMSLRNQKTRWGSCSARGHISINWRLIAAPEPIIDYVLIHELAHLEHPNHSIRFWKLVESHCSDWQSHRRWLRDHQLAFDFLKPSR